LKKNLKIIERRIRMDTLLKFCYFTIPATGALAKGGENYER